MPLEAPKYSAEEKICSNMLNMKETSKYNKTKIIAYTGTHGTGKTTSALQETINQKINHPNKSVHCLVDLEAFCPFPINRETLEESQAWLFANHLQQLLTTIQKYDIVILDRTLVDVIAYTKVAGFKKQAESMMNFLKFHINFYSEIRVKKIKDNKFCMPDGIRETKDLKFRQDIEDCLLNLYQKIQQKEWVNGKIYSL